MEIVYPIYSKLSHNDKLMFKRLVYNSTSEVGKGARDWIKRYESDGTRSRTKCMDKYFDNVEMPVSRDDRLPNWVDNYFTKKELEKIETGWESKLYVSYFTATLNNGYDYDEIPPVVFNILPNEQGFHGEDVCRFKIIKLDENFVYNMLQKSFTVDVLFEIFKDLDNELDIFKSLTLLTFCCEKDFVEKCRSASNASDVPDGLSTVLYLVEFLRKYFIEHWQCMTGRDWSNHHSCSTYIWEVRYLLQKVSVYMLIKTGNKGCRYPLRSIKRRRCGQ